MSWTEPPTFSSATTATASDANILSEDLRFLKTISDGTTFTGVDLQITGTQSIPDATDSDIIWGVEGFDYGSWWSTGATITVPASAVPAGYTTIAVYANATCRFVPDGSSGRAINILVNGTPVLAEGIRLSESDYANIGVSGLCVVAAGDAITVQVRQNSGASLNIDGARIQVVRYAPVA